MSDSENLADIVRSLRRTLEREPSASGELLARAAGASHARRTTAYSGRAEDARVPMTVQGPEPSSPRPTVPKPAAPMTDLFGVEEPDPYAAREPGRSAPAATLIAAPNPVDPGERAELDVQALPVLQEMAKEICACTRCGLAGTRNRAVPGTGSARSGIVFVGEAPGAEEDRQGEPFVGRAGELLTRIIQAMDDAHLIPGVPLSRETVYICNVLKCRPPENRNPLPHEVEACSPFLVRQLEALRPRMVCCLGKFAAELLLGVKGTIAGLRGRTYRYRGSKMIVTYHPAACLRNPNLKRPVWEDMQLLAREYQID